jgi:hypothetical protein
MCETHKLFVWKVIMNKRITIAASLLLSGCSMYVTPRHPAKLNLDANRSLSSTENAAPGRAALQRALYAKIAPPTLELPANLILARVKQDYSCGRTECTGDAPVLTVINTRSVESEEDLERVSKLEGISDVGFLNGIVATGRAVSVSALRSSAAKLNGDLLLIYMVDNDSNESSSFPLLSLLSLGFIPNQRHEANSTISAALVDVKTGYIYGTLEETARKDLLTTSWASDSVNEELQKETERAAFEKILGSLEKFWNRVSIRYASHSK